LSIAQPDGLRLQERAASRKVELPEPSGGQVSLMVVHGHDNGFDHGVMAPATVDVTPDSVTVLQISTEAIESGYLRELDPAGVDQVRVAGTLRGQHVEELVRLVSLQSLQASAIDQRLIMEKAEELQSKGEPVDYEALMAEQESQLSPEDLRPLALLPQLRRVDVMGGPDGAGLLPNVIGDWWLSPGLAAARREAGLSEYAGQEREHAPVDVSCLLTRRDDGLLGLKLNLQIEAGWYAYPPGSDEGIPVSMSLTTSHAVVESLTPESDAAHLEGHTALHAVLSGESDEVRVDVTVQVCDGESCLAPQTTHLVVPLMRKG
jgi:hypothetical protein